MRLTSVHEYLQTTKTKEKLCARGICTHHPLGCACGCVREHKISNAQINLMHGIGIMPNMSGTQIIAGM